MAGQQTGSNPDRQRAISTGKSASRRRLSVTAGAPGKNFLSRPARSPAPSCGTKEWFPVAKAWPLVLYTDVVVASPRQVGDMKKARLYKAETRVLEQFWKLGTSSVREILKSLPEDERVAYTTVQTLVYRLEEKGAVRKVKKIGNAQLFEPAINQSEFRSGLARDLLDLFGGSPRMLISNLLETGTLTLKDLKALQSAAPSSKKSRRLGGKGHA